VFTSHNSSNMSKSTLGKHMGGDGEEGVVEDPHMTQEGPNTASGGVGAVTFSIVPPDPVGEYLIPWPLLPDITHTIPYSFCVSISFCC